MTEESHDHCGQRPVSLLVDHLHLLPRGKVLDLALGTGRNALYLAERGFFVEGVDRDEDCVRQCLAAAARRGLSLAATVADLTDYRLSRGAYEVVLCFYYLDRALIPQIKAALKPGGVLLFETFLVDQHRKFGRPRHRHYCLEWNELLRSFLDFRILYYREGWAGAHKATASLVARRPGPGMGLPERAG